MTNEGHYYTDRRNRRRQFDSVFNYGRNNMRDDLFLQGAISPSPTVVYIPTTPQTESAESHCQKMLADFYQRKNILAQMQEDYFAAALVQDAPTKLLVSRRLYLTITKMPEFCAQTNKLYFFTNGECIGDYKPSPTNDRNVYVQIDPVRESMTDYFFQ